MAERFAPVLEPYGIDSRQFGILCVIGRNPGISQKSIGTNMRVDRTTMVALVDALESLGYCERSRSREDRRSYAIYLTARGKELTDELWGAMREVEDLTLDELPREVQDALLAVAATIQRKRRT
ncbi:MarR family winged helix-turn-helix transcriptional regulator [Bifidobacterium xylocopae]|nr:MarR family transcriptional regulator [Bifidobacterium xylocopae]